MKSLLTSAFIAALIALSPVTASAESAAAPAASSSTAPKTVVHVVTVTFKKDAKPEQIQAALDAVKQLPADYPGITRVWTKTMKAQGERTHAIVMEFASEQALKDYTDSPAQKKWYESYQPVRDHSTTFDITND
jgi:antibiotic biosynthesis monooxygenase (ABM) superfamily enzyme